MKQNDKQIPVILIVDDVEVNARLLKKMVEKMGYQGLTATGVKEAVSQMQKELPQLILLDIMMPDMSGSDPPNNSQNIKHYQITDCSHGHKGYSCHLCIGSQRA